MAGVLPSMIGSMASRLRTVVLAFRRAQCGELASARWHLYYQNQRVFRGHSLRPSFSCEIAGSEDDNLLHERRNKMRCTLAS